MPGFSLDKAPHSKPHFEGLEALIREEKAAAKGMGDFAKTSRDAAEAIARVASAVSSSADSAAAIAGMKAPTSNRGGGSSSPTAEAGSGFDSGSFVDRIASALRQAEAPLAAFGAHIDSVFDRVGGTIVEGFRRVDSNTKFPSIDKALTKIGHGFENTFRRIFGLSKKTWGDVGGTTESLERSIQSLERALKSLGPAARIDPLETSLKAVSASFTSIDSSLKAVSESFKALAPAAGPAALILREMAESAGKASAAAPLLAKDFVGVNVPPPGKRPGVRRQGMGPVKPPADAPAPAVVAARPAPSLSGGAAGVAKEWLAAVGPLGKALQSLAVKAGAVGLSLARNKPVAFLALAGSAELAVKAFGLLASSGAGAGASLAGLGASGAHAAGLIAAGFKLSAGAILGVSAAAGLSPLGLFALGGAAVGAAAIVVKLGQALFRVKFFTGSLGDVAGKTFSQLYSGAGLFKSALGATVGNAAKLAVTVATLGTVNPFRKAAADAAKIAPAMNSARSATARVSASVTGLGREVAVALGVFGLIYKVTSGLKDFFVSGVKGASDLNESMSAASGTFGKFAGVVSAQADRMAKDFGIGKKAQIDIATGYGEMAQGAGMSERASAGFANTFTKLAADLSSRKNIGFEEAAGKLQSALAGQSEPLREFGVLIDEDAVKSYALAHGLARTAQGLDSHAKFAARAALVQQGLATSNGDLERTAGEAANQFRKSSGGLANFATSVGQVLLPVVKSGALAFNDLLASVVEVFETNRPLFESWAASATAAMEMVGVVVRNAGSYWTIFKLSAMESLSNALAYIEMIPANLAIIGEYIGNNWSKLVIDHVHRVGAVFKNLGTNLGELAYAVYAWMKDPTRGLAFNWTPLLDGFEATAARLPELLKPELVSMRDQIDAEFAKIGAAEGKRKKMLGGAAEAAKKPAAGLAPKADQYEGPHFAGLAESGSKEAYSATIRHQYGRRDNGLKDLSKTADKQLEEARKQTKLLENMGEFNAPALEIMGI